MIVRLENAVEARLKAQLPGWTVEHFPDVPERYGWAQARTTLLVCCEGSTYGEPRSLSPLSVSRELSVSVTVLARSLRGPKSTAEAFESIKSALFGWEPTDTQGKLGCSPMIPVSEKFVSEDQGVWRFVAMYRSATISVVGILPLSGPPLKTTSSEPKEP